MEQAGNIVKCNQCDLVLEIELVVTEGVQDPYIVGQTLAGEPASISVAHSTKIAESDDSP
jgi:hypothetical protein